MFKTVNENIKNNQIDFINKVYFGIDENGTQLDYTRDYLLDDFLAAVKSIISIDLLYSAFGVISENDPRIGVLVDVCSCQEIGHMINLRKILKPERGKPNDNKKEFFKGEPGSCTAGDLLNDLVHLKTDDFKKYSHDNGRSYSEVEYNKLRALIKKANGFKSKTYYRQLVKSNEGIGFHKDNFPQKRDKRVVIISEKDPKIISTRYKKKFSVQLSAEAHCLEELADIISLYQELVPKVKRRTQGLIAKETIDGYVEKFYSLFFASEIKKEDISKAISEIKEHLKKSLILVGWMIDE